MFQVDILIKGSIDPEWSDWLAGLQIRPCENRETRLSGLLADQAALYGVLSRLNSLGLALRTVRVEEPRAEQSS